MTLHVLVVIDSAASRGIAEWFFDRHPHFLRARKWAQDAGVFITDRTEYVSDLNEFGAWLERKELKGQ